MLSSIRFIDTINQFESANFGQYNPQKQAQIVLVICNSTFYNSFSDIAAHILVFTISPHFVFDVINWIWNLFFLVGTNRRIIIEQKKASNMKYKLEIFAIYI